jgi:hypothetical protein
MLYFPARGAGDHSFATALLDVATNGSAVVAFVAERLLRIAVDVAHKGRICGDIVGLARRDPDADWQALGIGAGIDFGRKAAARTAEGVAHGPPLPKRLQDHIPDATIGPSPKLPKDRIQLPNSSGRSRQVAPVRHQSANQGCPALNQFAIPPSIDLSTPPRPQYSHTSQCGDIGTAAPRRPSTGVGQVQR